jgi:hypothetical protein
VKFPLWAADVQGLWDIPKTWPWVGVWRIAGCGRIEEVLQAGGGRNLTCSHAPQSGFRWKISLFSQFSTV